MKGRSKLITTVFTLALTILPSELSAQPPQKQSGGKIYKIERTGTADVMPGVNRYLQRKDRAAAATARDRNVLYIETEQPGGLVLSPGDRSSFSVAGRNIQEIRGLQPVINDRTTKAVRASLGPVTGGRRTVTIQALPSAPVYTRVNLAFSGTTGMALPAPIKIAIVPREEAYRRGRLKEDGQRRIPQNASSEPPLAVGGRVVLVP